MGGTCLLEAAEPATTAARRFVGDASTPSAAVAAGSSAPLSSAAREVREMSSSRRSLRSHLGTVVGTGARHGRHDGPAPGCRLVEALRRSRRMAASTACTARRCELLLVTDGSSHERVWSRRRGTTAAVPASPFPASFHQSPSNEWDQWTNGMTWETPCECWRSRHQLRGCWHKPRRAQRASRSPRKRVEGVRAAARR